MPEGATIVGTNAPEAEVDYYKKTGIIPIMHVLVMRRSIVERYPELPHKLFELFCQAKKLGRRLDPIGSQSFNGVEESVSR